MPEVRRGFTVMMPALGESVTEGTVTQWCKRVGDRVELDEALLEVSTDKVDIEIPAPAAGTLLELFVREDETVEVGAPLALIGDPADLPRRGPAPVVETDLGGPAEAVLVVDFGTTTTSAAIVTAGGVRLVKEPATGTWSWPSAVCLDGADLLVGTLAENVKRVEPAAFRDEVKRDLGATEPVLLGEKAFRAVELVTELIAALRRQAEREHGSPVRRAVLTVPATYGHRDPRWSEMIEAGERAGFTEVELLPEPAAAALAPTLGAPLPAGHPVLVFDFGGGTFDAAVVRAGTVLGCAALDDCGGRDVDAMLAARAVALGGARLAEQLEPADDHPDAVLDAQHVRMDLAEFVRRAKHHLTDAAVARDYLRPARTRIELEQRELAALVAPLLDRAIVCCRDLLARLGIAASDLGAVVLVGGSSRMPAVAGHVEHAFGLVPRQAEDLALAVVTGAADWVRRRTPTVLAPSGPSPDHRPLCWDLPDGTATLVRWLVEPGERVGPGVGMAVVRTADGALARLTNGFDAGWLRARHVEPGDVVASGEWLVTLGTGMPGPSATARASATDRTPAPDDVAPVFRHNAAVRAVAITADGRLLTAAGDDVSIWRLDDPRVPSRSVGMQPGIAWIGVPQGATYYVSGSSRSVCRRRLVTGKLISEVLTGGHSAMAVAADGTVAVVSDAGGVDVIAPGATRSRLSVEVTGGATDVAFAPDGALVIATRSGTVEVRSAAGRLAVGVRTSRTLRTRTGAAAIPLVRLAVSGNADRVAAATGSGIVHVWDGGEHHGRLPSDPAVTAMELSPDGRLLATAHESGLAVVWNLNRAETVLRAEHGAPVHAVAFHDDGGRIVTGCADGTARVLTIGA